MPNFVRLAALDDIPENSMRGYEYEGQRIALYRVGGTLYATSDICSHEYALLTEGFLDEEECLVECPLHGSRFDLRTGAALSLPAYEPIKTYEVRVEGEDILVEIGD
jgi:nitrite reductase/ring-hydroxylating ferredoxin subunit